MGCYRVSTKNGIDSYCNVNRINQSPVNYAESVVKEVKLRMEIGDEKVKSAFSKYHNVKTRGDKDEHNVVFILDSIFGNLL
jgi:hypothetical protein